ncbi:MAG: acetyl-CoA carboxylase carboxyl transferase subunit beta [Aerococcus sp.]|nr:acetyl-CoA carboxylase carboxyl transferase subunit beta [Aerococcus sp.]
MTKCPKCHTQFFSGELGTYHTCPHCGYGFRVSAQERVNWIFDDYQLINEDITVSEYFLVDNQAYQKKVDSGKARTHLNESVMTGIGKIDNMQTAFGIMDPFFVMGSLGSGTGEKIARLFEMATERRLPVVMFTASGGARMQEGIHSLMQMAKTSQAVAKHHEAGLFYLVVLCDPTTGGVTASYAMQGDIVLAESQALVGFAGRRVIEQTMMRKPPEDFQDAETVLANGFIDAVVPREDIRSVIAQLLAFHQHEGARISD